MDLATPYLNYGMTVLKYDSAGNKTLAMDAHRFRKVWYDSAYMQVDPAGNVYITGNNFFTAKLDPNGNGLWTNHYGGPLIPTHGQFSTDITFDQNRRHLRNFPATPEVQRRLRQL